MRLRLAKQGILSIFQNNLASSIVPAAGACCGKRKRAKKIRHIKKAESPLMGWLELEVSFFLRAAVSSPQFSL